MSYNDRKALMQQIEELRGGRTLVSLFNFDRLSEPYLSGISTQFYGDVKEPLFRVLKASRKRQGIDLLLYTRGGDINAVWPVVSLVREFDRHFQVLLPFKCHSSGTLVALGAERIVLGPLSELSPIDPSTGNAFNPVDPGNAGKKMSISVGDVQAYRTFMTEQYKGSRADGTEPGPEFLLPLMDKLIERVHPLAIGNVQRVSQQIRQLAENLLRLHAVHGENIPQMVDALCNRFHSHLHMINRHEAREILGQRVEFAPARLAAALDNLLLAYEDAFQLRRTFYAQAFLQGKPEADAHYAGAIVESKAQSWLFRTHAKLRLPAANPAGAGNAKRGIEIEIQDQGWRQHRENGNS